MRTPEWLPEICREAAQSIPEYLLSFPGYRAEARRILTDETYRGFWEEVAEVSRAAGFLAPRFLVEFISIMMTKGGSVPTETLAEKKERRRRLAALLRRLRGELIKEPELENLALTRLIGFSDSGVELENTLRKFRKPCSTP